MAAIDQDLTNNEVQSSNRMEVLVVDDARGRDVEDKLRSMLTKDDDDDDEREDLVRPTNSSNEHYNS